MNSDSDLRIDKIIMTTLPFIIIIIVIIIVIVIVIITIIVMIIVWWAISQLESVQSLPQSHSRDKFAAQVDDGLVRAWQ